MMNRGHVSVVSLFTLVGALIACGDEGAGPLAAAGSAGAAGDARALSRVDPAGEAECPGGGSVVSSGIDGDGDGALADGEIDARQVVCHPETPKVPPEGAPLSRSSRVPPGGACPLGGSALAWGRDDDGNGVLDDGEVETTSFVCDAALGSRMRAEPPGEHCAEGGIAFLTGRDDDGDGELGDAEVESIGYECTDRIARDVVVRTPADAALLAGIRIIDGSLTVPDNDGEPTGLVVLDLPKLEVVSASVSFRGIFGELAQVSLPALVAIGGGLYASGLSSLELGSLRSVAGDLQLESNGLGGLGGLSGLAALERIGGSLLLQSNGLVDATLPALHAVGGALELIGNHALAEANFALDEGPTSLLVLDNKALTSLRFRSTPPFYDPCAFGEVMIIYNDALTSASVEARCAANVVVSSNGALDELELALGGADRVRIENPALRALTLRNGHEPFVGFRADALVLDAPIESLSFGGDDGTFHTLDVRGTRLVDFGSVAGPVDRVYLYEDAYFEGNPLLERLELTWENPSQGGDLYVYENPALQRVKVGGGFHYFVGSLSFVNNPLLSELQGLDEMYLLEGSLTIFEGAFEHFDWPELQTVTGSLSFSHIPTLRQADFSDLEEASSLSFIETGLESWPTSGKLARVGGIHASSNPALQNVALGALTWADARVHFEDNASLHALDFGSLYGAKELIFVANPGLSVCKVEGLFAQVDAHLEIQHGNDADCHD